MAAASRPDVVLLDIGLPGMDGYQVAKRLRERPEFKDVMMCAFEMFHPQWHKMACWLGRGFTVFPGQGWLFQVQVAFSSLVAGRR